MRYKVSPRARLIVFGCSYTYGHGLKDCIIPPFFQPGPEPSKYAWPHLLAARLGIQYQTFSKPGGSVKFMWHAALNHYVPQDEDIVIPLWTLPNRSCVITGKELTDVDHIQVWEDTKRSKNYYKFFSTEYEDAYDYFLRLNHFNYYFKDKVKLIINGMLNHHAVFEKYKEILPNWNETAIDFEFHKIGEKYPFAEDGGHWNEDAHAELSEVLYKMIGEKLGYV